MSLLLSALAEENRRGIGGVTGGVVGGGNTDGGTVTPTPGGGGTTTPDPVDPGSGNISPISSVDLWKSYGVQHNPTRYDQPYAGNSGGTYSKANNLKVIALLDAMGVAYVRMKYNPKNAGASDAITELRARGMKAIMTVTAESDQATSNTEAETRAAVQGIAAEASDVCIGIEGINEPNHNRSGNPVIGGWAQIVVNHQKYIAEEIAASTALNGVVENIGSSLHDNAASASYNAAKTLATRAGCTYDQITPKGFVLTQAALPTTGRTVGDTWYIQDGTERNFTWTGSAWTTALVCGGGVKHFHQLVRDGILDYITMSGQHTYPGPGDSPLGGRDGGYASRVHTQWDAYGDGFPIWATEWGYTTPPKTTSGHATAMPEAAATYGPRALLEFYGGYNLRDTPRKRRLCRFEGLDDYDATKASAEAWFGIFEVGQTSKAASYDNTTWSAKPEVAKMKEILTFLKPAKGWAATYTPPKMDLTVNLGTSTDVRWKVVGKPDGTCHLFYWRNQLVQKNTIGTPKDLITVPAVSFNYTDSTGKHTVSNADGEVRWVEVFR